MYSLSETQLDILIQMANNRGWLQDETGIQPADLENLRSSGMIYQTHYGNRSLGIICWTLTQRGMETALQNGARVR